MIAPESADSRAHPDKAEDVWELSVWDPLPICVRLFCLFSPGHVLVYLMFLPLAPLDPRPSVTVFNTILVQVVLSTQLLFLASRFAQQAKDQAIIQKEVMHEYDTKFVHPHTHPIVRDAGTQISEDQPPHARELVQVGTPTTLVRLSHFHQRHTPHQPSSDNSTPSRGNIVNTYASTPTNPARRSEAHISASQSRPSTSRKSLPATYTTNGTSTPGLEEEITTPGNVNYGGNMGIHTHTKSPLKKTSSLHNMNDVAQPSPRTSREVAAYEQDMFKHRRQSSPVKRVEGYGSARPNPFAPSARQRTQQERYPLMR